MQILRFCTKEDILMPFINTKTNIALSRKQKELAKAALADCIAALNPELPNVLMCNFEDSCSLSFAGDSIKPASVTELHFLESTLRTFPEECLEKVAKAVTEVISKTFVIDPDRIFVFYAGSPKWMYNGQDVK